MAHRQRSHPRAGEAWLARFPAWKETHPEVLDEFAAQNAAKWSRKARQTTVKWIPDLAASTAQWSAFRRKNAPKQPQPQKAAYGS
jgi:hypothetical protein